MRARAAGRGLLTTEQVLPLSASICVQPTESLEEAGTTNHQTAGDAISMLTGKDEAQAEILNPWRHAAMIAACRMTHETRDTGIKMMSDGLTAFGRGISPTENSLTKGLSASGSVRVSFPHRC